MLHSLGNKRQKGFSKKYRSTYIEEYTTECRTMLTKKKHQSTIKKLRQFNFMIPNMQRKSIRKETTNMT